MDEMGLLIKRENGIAISDIVLVKERICKNKNGN
jgi:hypothetical protein